MPCNLAVNNSQVIPPYSVWNVNESNLGASKFAFRFIEIMESSCRWGSHVHVEWNVHQDQSPRQEIDCLMVGSHAHYRTIEDNRQN